MNLEENKHLQQLQFDFTYAALLEETSLMGYKHLHAVLLKNSKLEIQKVANTDSHPAPKTESDEQKTFSSLEEQRASSKKRSAAKEEEEQLLYLINKEPNSLKQFFKYNEQIFSENLDRLLNDTAEADDVIYILTEMKTTYEKEQFYYLLNLIVGAKIIDFLEANPSEETFIKIFNEQKKDDTEFLEVVQNLTCSPLQMIAINHKFSRRSKSKVTCLKESESETKSSEQSELSM